MTLTVSESLTEFLRGCIAEDEADARQLAKELDRWRREKVLNGPDGTQGSVVASLLRGSVADPDRILADCEAMRRVLDLAEAARREGEFNSEWPVKQFFEGRWSLARAMLRALALQYADRPGYRQDYRP